MRTNLLKITLTLTIALILAAVPASALGVSAECAVLYDPVSQRILYEKSAESKMLIASTTKIMTAIVVLEHSSPDEIVVIGREPTQVEGSSMYLREGEELTVRELLYGLLLVSGNDAATALALHVSGDIESFAVLMNETAKKIGMSGSSFANPHGLDHELHYSTALDMAKLTAYAMANPEFESIVATKDCNFDARHLHNHNKLLWRLEGSDGVKTGYTKRAGRCLVSSATRDGHRLIAVTLNAPSDWADHAAMINHGFASYPPRALVSENAVMANIPVVSGLMSEISVSAGSRVTLALSDSELSRLTREINLPNFVYAPVNMGDMAGTISFSLDGKKLAEVELTYDETVPALPTPTPEPGFWDFLDFSQE